ncbi:MAG: SUMF1/EgtB/PvdO family nonheme iron enzyme, partial [Planctomycetes bacterium]|nr:SUMF1/EgtB/PvdO family nonheme iron enzyme [Planctomycetota bacterium]
MYGTRKTLVGMTFAISLLPLGIFGCRKSTPEGGSTRSQHEYLTLNLGGVDLKLVRIPQGTFLMGSSNGERGRAVDEGPQHQVTISREFYMGVHEVTQAQWRAMMMDRAPWGGRQYVREGDDVAASYVTWKDATEFCRRLSANLAALTDRGAAMIVRLP